MYLSELNWEDVPEDVSVLMDENDEKLNFVKNLSRPAFGPCRYEGDECNIKGLIFSYSEGWYKTWTLLERPDKKQEKIATRCPVYSCPVAEFLMKLGYVVASDNTIAGLDVNLKTKEVFICTDFGDITGITQVIDYVNHNYAVKIKQEADKRKQELEDKRLKVLAELSEIDQELGRY